MKLCIQCDIELHRTNHFCSMICAERFNQSEDEANIKQQDEEISYIMAMCYGDIGRCD